MSPEHGVALRRICEVIDAAVSTRPQLAGVVRSSVNRAYVMFAASNNFVAIERDLHRILAATLAAPEMSQERADAIAVEAAYRQDRRNDPDAWQKLVDAYHAGHPPHLISHRLRQCWSASGPLPLEVLFAGHKPSEPEPPAEPAKISVGETLGILQAKFGEKVVGALRAGAHTTPPTVDDAKVRELVRDRIDPEALLPSVSLLFPAEQTRKRTRK
jgi:hypothetical protein